MWNNILFMFTLPSVRQIEEGKTVFQIQFSQILISTNTKNNFLYIFSLTINCVFPIFSTQKLLRIYGIEIDIKQLHPIWDNYTFYKKICLFLSPRAPTSRLNICWDFFNEFSQEFWSWQNITLRFIHSEFSSKLSWKQQIDRK